MKNAVIVLAGGSGSRMKSKTKKQYMKINERPVLWYSLNVFEHCSRIDDVILVCGKGETEYCRQTYCGEFGFQKIRKITEGGKERYHSVYEGLKKADDCRNVLIHDGARPFVDEEMIGRILDALEKDCACAAGMPAKDTIKKVNLEKYAEETLPREKLWMIQTPQGFHFSSIMEGYRELMEMEAAGELQLTITDDAMVAEYICRIPVKLVEGSYRNIKITTPEDLIIAEAMIACRNTVNDGGKQNKTIEIV